MKGQLYTLESIISILMIFFIIIFLFQNPQGSPEFEKVNYKLKAYNGLKSLEKTGELRRHVSNNNATAIKESLDPFIPIFLGCDVVIFNDTTNITAKPSLTNIDESISVTYFLAGDVNDYKARDVRVYMWEYEISTTTSTTTVPSCNGVNVKTCKGLPFEDCLLPCCTWVLACETVPCEEIGSEAQCHQCNNCFWQ